MVRLGFIIGLLALIGTLALGARGLSRARAGAGDRRHRAGARDRRPCQPGAGSPDRARTPGARRFRTVSYALGGQGEHAAAAALLDLCLQDRFRRRRLDRAAQAGRARCRAEGACQRRLSQSRPSAIMTTSRSIFSASTSRSTC